MLDDYKSSVGQGHAKDRSYAIICKIRRKYIQNLNETIHDENMLNICEQTRLFTWKDTW